MSDKSPARWEELLSIEKRLDEWIENLEFVFLGVSDEIEDLEEKLDDALAEAKVARVRHLIDRLILSVESVEDTDPFVYCALLDAHFGPDADIARTAPEGAVSFSFRDEEDFPNYVNTGDEDETFDSLGRWETLVERVTISADQIRHLFRFIDESWNNMVACTKGSSPARAREELQRVHKASAALLKAYSLWAKCVEEKEDWV